MEPEFVKANARIRKMSRQALEANPIAEAQTSGLQAVTITSLLRTASSADVTWHWLPANV
jgi:hypothetical protein